MRRDRHKSVEQPETTKGTKAESGERVKRFRKKNPEIEADFMLTLSTVRC